MYAILKRLTPALPSLHPTPYRFASSNKLFQKQSKLIFQPGTAQKNIEDSDIRNQLLDYQQYFKEQRALLPTYLRRVNKVMKGKTANQYKQKFEAIYYELNRCSSQLVLKAHECLEILIFVDKYLSYAQSKYDQVVNNGFEHRAAMLAATFLLNRQFTITQAIAIYQILTRVGCVSILFVANLTKFLKLQLQSQQGKELLVEHIIVLLNIYILKNNHTILENVLQDMTIHYLLNHHQLIHSTSTTLQIQLLCLLLRVDLRYFYLSEEGQFMVLIEALIREIRRGLKEINIKHVVYLLQSLNYTASHHPNRLINEGAILLREELRQIARNKLEDNSLDRSTFMRILVVSGIALNKQINSIVGLTEIQQSSFYPLIDKYYEKQGKEKGEILQLITNVWRLLNLKKQFIPSIAKIVIQNADINNVISQICSIKLRVCSKDNLSLYALLLYIKYKYPQLALDPALVNLESILVTKIQRLKEDKLKFINCIYQTIHTFRDIQFPYIWLKHIIQLNSKDFLKISHPNRIVRDQYQVQLIYISSFMPNQSSFLFKEHNIYSYLLLLYPQNHPQVKYYDKRFNFLSIDASFKNNIGFIGKLVGTLDKYYYLLWDIFINNYILRSATVRKNCFELLKAYFLKAYRKQTARKVVLLTSFTNYISSGKIIASKAQLQELVELCLNPLLDSNIKDKFHYHCFLQITFNCRSANILSDQYFSKIIIRCLSADNCEPRSFKASTLMLLYGHSLKQRAGNVYIEFYEEQRQYLKDMLGKNLLVVGERTRVDRSHKLIVAGTKFICVLLQFAQPQILAYQARILQFIKCRVLFSQIMQLIYSFKVCNFDLNHRQMKDLAVGLNKAFFAQITYLKENSLIEDYHLQAVISRLKQNQRQMSDNE